MVRVVDSKGKDLKNPFGGGIKFPVFTTLDLNFDKKPDLIVLDRSDDRILTFINEGGLDTIKYIYRPEYEDLFPKTLNKYILFLDYNKDGKPDMFSFASKVGGGVELYKNISFGNKILFEPYLPDPEDSENSALVSTFYDNSYIISVLVKSCDIPCLIDADKDGDVDFFTFDDMGGSYLWYFKNFSQEINGNADSMKFNMADSYWGYFMEGDNSNLVYLGRKNPSDWKHYSIMMPELKRHAGSTVFVNDMNGDGDLDLLVGDVGYPGIRYLINGKKQTNSQFDSIIDQDTFFPTLKPVNIHNMPSAFNIDVNNDGIKDFVFSPMDETLIDGKYIDGLKQIWYYKNTGADNNPVLNFVKDNFIQEDMVDLGGSTSPAFFDFDGDGDLDLFVATKGNNIETRYLADRIVLFNNIGTTSKPVFQKTDDNYLNLTAKGFKALSIHFGDVDADGNKDLIMGASNGHLIYYKNNPVNDSAVFTYITDYFDSIDVGDYSVPALSDIDKDSLSELIIGSKNGNIYYWKNIGSSGTPYYELVTDSFGKISILGGDHYSAPIIADMDTNGHPDLILSYNDIDLKYGLVTSKVKIYKDIDLQTQPYKSIDTLFYNVLTSNAVKKYIGRKLRPTTADLDGDRIPDLIFGSERGGLLFYGSNTSLSTQIKVTGKTILCKGDSAILDAGSGFDSYLWNTGAKTQQIVVKKAGSFECTVQKGSFSYKAYSNIQMHPDLVKANFTYTNNDMDVTFTLLNDNVDSVRWSFGDTSYSNVKNPIHSYKRAGNYSVCVEIFDNCGSTDDTCRKISVVGLQDDPNRLVAIYPNPVERLLFVKCNPEIADHKYLLNVSDALGRSIINREIIMKQNLIIDFSSIIPGVYQLSLSDSKSKLILKSKLLKVGDVN